MFSRDFRRPKTAKFKIYLIFEDCRGFRCGSLFGAVVVSTGCRWCRAALAILLTLAKMDKSPPISRFPALRLVCWLEICLYFAFLGGFDGVLWCLCGFVLPACFAWLVGLLYACAVRRFRGLWRVCLPFSLFLCVCLAFVHWAFPLSAFRALCSCCTLFASLWLFVCCCCFFPFGCTDKKKGREGLPLASSLVVVGCFIWLLLCIPRTRQVSAR